ncbi:MAG: leucyl/phenylalanyl-tRNA--protein transferase [Betaproteobacteria bacterium]|nr:leucyl/phenylalanyl-tRNA--protein transferase [Betaproteobacteria bacterium]MCH9848538.1 leucyl/phenylalanyl-tRNA--protein transferase [Betaproteobacteria bacterium]
MADQYYKLSDGYVLALEAESKFPPLTQALKEPNGLIAIGGDLSSKRLLAAYSHGVFPWFSEDDPIMWWSPNPRMVLFPTELKVSSSLKKTLKKNPYHLSINNAFREVITACSQVKRPDQAGTWINQDMIDAYCELHDLGHAVSSESWLNNQLVGGCYGVIIGQMFYGESMFHTQSDASKIAFVHLVNYLKTKNVGMIDCQMKTPLLTSFGGREIPREVFSQTLSKLIHLTA